VLQGENQLLQKAEQMFGGIISNGNPEFLWAKGHSG
jgi:hypothetical protein